MATEFTPTQTKQRENINDALKKAYETIDEAGVSIDAQFGRDKFAEQWQVENAVQESYKELHRLAETGDEDAIKARDEVFELLKEVEENRSALKDAGIDVKQVALSDNPLKNNNKQEAENLSLDRRVATNQGAAIAISNTAALATAGDARNAGTAVTLNDTAADVTAKEGVGAAIIRGAHQCFLLYNMHYFAPFHRLAVKSGLSRVSGDGTKRLETKYKSVDKEGNYRTPGYEKMLLMKEEKDTTAAINSLLACGGDEAFSNITTAEYAQLQPLLKIYKIYASPDKGNVAAHQPGIVEVEFSAATNIDGIAKQLTSQHPPPSESDYKSWARGANSGVQSFEWRFLGTDPFTATRDVEATLKLSIQHFSELIKVRQGENLGGGDKKTLSYRYVDLLVQPDCRDASGKDIYNDSYNPECYEVRVDVGYQDPSLSGQTTLSKGILDSIACQRQSLYLTLVDHKFEFKNDGTIAVVVNFRGRLGSVMRDKKFNILMPGGGFREIEFPDPDNKGEKLKILNIETQMKDARSENPVDKKKIKNLQRLKNIFFVNKKQSLYNGTLSRLQKAGMVFSHVMTPLEWIIFSQWQQQDKLAKASLPEPLSYTSSSIQNAGSATDAKVLTQAASTDVDAEGASDANAALSEYLEGNRDRLTGNKGKVKRIHYVYLGDLLAVVFQNVTGKSTYEEIRTQGWIGPVSVKDVPPGNPGQLRHEALVDKFNIILGNIDVTLARPEGQIGEFTCNLAHIPISLEVFREFWTEKVLMKDIVFYSFFQFVDDLVQDMLTQALSSGCFDGLIDQAVRSHTVLANSVTPISPEVYKIVDKPSSSGLEATVKAKGVHALSSTPQTPAFKKSIPPGIPGASGQPANPYQYLIIQVSEQSPSNLAGNYAADVDKGIIHLGYGRDRGLLKNVSFQKTNQEYLPEARYASEGNFVFNQLANVYDATFTMVGNNLFSPGKYIYFDTSDQGMGSPPERIEDSSGNVTHRSWANIMGLGGYHLVTEISNTIDRNGYNTNVKARWTTSGVSDQITGGAS